MRLGRLAARELARLPFADAGLAPRDLPEELLSLPSVGNEWIERGLIPTGLRACEAGTKKQLLEAEDALTELGIARDVWLEESCGSGSDLPVPDLAALPTPGRVGASVALEHLPTMPSQELGMRLGRLAARELDR